MPPPAPVPPLRAAAVLLGSTVMWGFTWWPLQWFATRGFGGAQISLIAYGAVAVLGLPWLWRQRSAWRRFPIALPLAALCGGWTLAGYTDALSQDQVLRALLLFYLAPLWSVLGGWMLLGESPDAPRWAALALALTGAVLLLGGPALLEGAATPPGRAELLALTAGLAFAGMNLAIRRAQHAPLTLKVAGGFCAASLIGAIQLTAGAPIQMPDAHGGLLLAGFGLGWMLLATATTQYGVSHLRAGTAGILLLNELLVAVLSASLLRGDTLQGSALTGAACVLGAGLVEALAGLRPARAAPRI